MDVTELPLAGLTLIRPRLVADGRGTHAEVWREDAIRGMRFAQENVSRSTLPGTVRGLHYQAPPHAQAKLITVIAGSVVVVVVDIRRGSPSFGRFHAVKLAGATMDTLFVPEGFANGSCTLEPDTLVAMRFSSLHVPGQDAGIAWDDPDLGIPWPIPAREAILSDRDRRHPRLASIESPFAFEG